MKTIILIPFGGLANRLRAIASGLALRESENVQLKILWIDRPELNCPYNKLLEGIAGVSIKNVSNNYFWKALLRYIKTVSLPNFSVITDDFIKEELEEGYFGLKANYKSFWKGRLKEKNLIISCRKFYKYSFKEMNLLKPHNSILTKLNSFVIANDLKNFIGFHIRYTDNQLSLNHSPIELFEFKIKECLANGKKIVVCTDSDFIKERLSKEFENRIIFPLITRNRTSIEGLQDAYFELLLLSRSEKIYASYGSTFSLYASELGGCELSLMKVKEKTE
ncbi:MAG: hypothetical protein WCR14_05735 [Bacteroidaceae bacterium]